MIGGRRFGSSEPGARARLVRRVVYAVMGALLGLAAGIAISSTQPQRYESTMQLLVGPVGADRSTLDASGLLSRTYADLLTSRNAVNRAADSLGVTVADGDVTAIADDKSRVILLVVQSDDPATPPRLATTLAADLIVLVEGSQQEDDVVLDARNGPGQVRVLDNATDPAQPLRRVAVLTLFGTTLAGAGVGLALGTFAPRSRRRPIDRPYLELIGLNVISLEQVTSRGRRGFLSRRSNRPVVNKRDEYELVFQQLLIACAQQGPFRTIMFVPADRHVQDDTVQLMLLLAQAGRRLSCSVDLADVDANSPLLVDLGARTGGVEILKMDQPDTESGVNRVGRLTRASEGQLLFLSTPAIGSSVRALTAAAAVDRIVVVARTGETERREVKGLLDDLGSLNVKPVVVFELGRGDLVVSGDLGAQPAGGLVAPVGEDSSASEATAVIGLVESEESPTMNGDRDHDAGTAVDDLDSGEILADDFDALFDDLDGGDAQVETGSETEADDDVGRELDADDFDAMFADAGSDDDLDDEYDDLDDDDEYDEDDLDDDEYDDLADDDDELDVDDDLEDEYDDLTDDEDDLDDDEYDDLADDEHDDLDDDDGYDNLDDDYDDLADADANREDADADADDDREDADVLAEFDDDEAESIDELDDSGEEDDSTGEELTFTRGSSAWKL